VAAAVGLVQNLGALRALTTVGIIEGHMKLHARNLSLGAGARLEEVPVLQQRLEEILRVRKRISHSNAVELLQEMRSAAAGG
jgi:hydroxymethylglutaryl-CoA reductase